MKLAKIITFSIISALAAVCMTFSASAADGIAIDEKTFPGEVLRDYISKHYDTDKDGVLSAEETAAAQKLNINIMDTNEYFVEADYPEVDLTGINYFTDLKVLNICDCKVINADISGLNNLEDLRLGTSVEGLVLCDMNSLWSLQLNSADITELTIDNLPVFSYCDLSDNPQLTKLEVSNCGNLSYIDCSNCSLESFKVSNCEMVGNIKCQNNKLTSLDISDGPLLKLLHCSGNMITDFDLTSFPYLITYLKNYDPDTTADIPLIVDETTKVKGLENIPTKAEITESVKNENIAANNNDKGSASLILFIISVVVLVGGVVSLVIISMAGKSISK